MNHLEFMRMAETEALKSMCKRAQVGAVVVRTRPSGEHVWVDLFVGWNHVNFNTDACCEDERGRTLADVVHAEADAIRRAPNVTGATLYVTRQPCLACAKLIVESGIKQVYYRDADDKNDGLQWLDDHGVSFDSRWKMGQIQDRYYMDREGRG